MTKFKCKKCGKMIPIIEQQEEQVCSNCGTEYEHVYDGGWKYDIKGYRTRKCLYCKSDLFIKKPSVHEGESITKHQCEKCGNTNLADWLHGSCILVPSDLISLKCSWCGEFISMNISETTQKWIEKKEAQYQSDVITCPHCGRVSKVSFFVGGAPLVNTFIHRVYMRGRKKKVTLNEVEQFVYKNSIYKVYGIIHVNSIIDFCGKNHFDEDAVCEIIDKMKIPIFSPIDIAEVDVSKYEDKFKKLKLKEDAMTSAGGASLSGLMGRTKAWKDLRNMLLNEKNFTCEICGYQADSKNAKSLHVHEEWEAKGKQVLLKKVSLICNRCHACKHVNNFGVFRVIDGADELVEGIPRMDFITIHLMKVNHVEKEVIYAYRKQLHMEWRKFEEQTREKFIKGIQEETQEYCYDIAESIPNRGAIVEYLSRKNLMNEENK